MTIAECVCNHRPLTPFPSPMLTRLIKNLSMSKKKKKKKKKSGGIGLQSGTFAPQSKNAVFTNIKHSRYFHLLSNFLLNPLPY